MIPKKPPPEDISLTEEEKKSIKSNVQSITDKRAAILSKEKGLEFSDYTFVSEQNGTSPAKEIKFPINSVDIENQIGEETKTRARTIKGSETNILFSDIAGMDAYISGNSVTITVKEGTSMKEYVKKHTALRHG